MKTFSPDKESHIPVLDGVRGVAILMVLVFHFWQGINSGIYHFSPGITKVCGLLSIGQKGVDLFFVLSGFLITGILMRSKGAAHYFKNFYIRRSLRIFPLYFATVFACLIAGKTWGGEAYQWHNNWWYLCYLQNIGSTFWPGSVAGPGHFWSLAVEEHFYLFWPLAVLVLSRRGLAWFSISLILASIVIRGYFLMKGIDVFTFTLCRMDTLALGALLAILFTHSDYWRKVVEGVKWLILPVAGLAFGSFFVVSGTGNSTIQTFKYTLFAALCGFVLVLALATRNRNPLPWLFQLKWLRAMGKISYAMYVFHPFIYGVVIGRFYQATWSPVRGNLWPALGLELVLALSLTIIASWISWVAFEHPLIRLKERFQYEDRSALQTR
jgi:peptidoglycan/LPS O-acetylase OafA/YrhL